MGLKVKGYTEKIYNQNEISDLINEIEVLIGDLGWDYDRMSQSGQETYDKLVNFVESL
jgi:hypothetical protein